MWSIIKNNIPGVAMIAGTGAVYGWLIEPHTKMILLSGGGALVGGIAAIGLFGHPGRWGWGLAALGAFVATALGAGLAGGLLYFPDGLWVAPIMVAIFSTEVLVAGPIWASLMIATHLVVRILRQRAGNSDGLAA